MLCKWKETENIKKIEKKKRPSLKWWNQTTKVCVKPNCKIIFFKDNKIKKCSIANQKDLGRDSIKITYSSICIHMYILS